MFKLLRYVAAAVAMLLFPALSGCAVMQASQPKKVTIGLAVANQQADFFNQIRQAAQDEAGKSDVEILLADANGNADTQVSQIQDFITKKVDAIIYIPAGASAASVPVRRAKEANIPVITVDRNPTDVPGDTFIATDSVAAARDLGTWVVQNANGRTNLAVVQGQLGTTPEVARDTGFKEGLSGSPIKQVVQQASQKWAQDEGFNITQDMLQSHPEINIIFGRADALALGAANAVRAKGAKEVMIVGFDGDVAGLLAVRDGVLSATVTQKTQLMGRLAVQSAIKLHNGETLPAEQLQEGIVTTKDNVGPFIDEHP